MSYIGWIPTVSGRLAFSEFGISDNPTQSITSSFVTIKERHIITYQKRYLSDVIIPIFSYSREVHDFLGLLIFNRTGKLWFTCSATYISQDDALEGVIGLFDKETWRDTTEAEVRELQSALRKCDGSAEASISDFVNIATERALFCAKYSVARNGTFRIAKIGNVLPSCSENGASDEELCLQCYYYIKDNLHTHKHHSERTDSILSLYADDDSIDWKMGTLYSIYRKIIARRRSGSVVDFIEGLGVLSYAESFRCIFSDHFDELKMKSEYNRQQMIESLNSSLYKASYYENQRKITRSYVLFSLTTFGLIVSLASLISASNQRIENISQELINIVDFIANYPMWTFSMLLVTSLVWSISLEPENKFSKNIFLDFRRILFALNRKFLPLTILSFSGAAALLFYGIFF
ncbi:hypothetical protein [Stappia sp. TSB10GB4]|uniref:hypothetical protein n=1 Tax=Stappia sp. TSB10GB4 TaxID=2003584 RepID=UPI001AD8F2E7|nr:hypothetical protein [Stappia sp. TSB10GB4]